MGPAALPMGASRAVKRRQHGQMAAMIRIAQWQAQQSSPAITHVKFRAAACFQQGNTGESFRQFFNAAVRLHGFFVPQNHACCDEAYQTPLPVGE
jgi:hypothetical protein